MRHTTVFNTSRHHIYLNSTIADADGLPQVFRSVLDTGAPRSEFSDRFLKTVGMLHESDIQNIPIPTGLQTGKYGSIIIPRFECMGQILEDFQVTISKFEEHWGVDALIGLDFFRRFRVTIDYEAGQIITEPLSTTLAESHH